MTGRLSQRVSTFSGGSGWVFGSVWLEESKVGLGSESTACSEDCMQ